MSISIWSDDNTKYATDNHPNRSGNTYAIICFPMSFDFGEKFLCRHRTRAENRLYANAN